MTTDTLGLSIGDGHLNSDAEAELLDRLRAGDPLAFETLLQRYEAPVYRFFFFSHGDHDRAQDECGETFAQLVTTIAKMRGGSEALRAFVFGVARNVQRRSWRGTKLELTTDEDLQEVAAIGELPLESISRRQEFERAVQYIRQFDDPARQAMLLRYVEDLKVSEVAAALDIPVNTVKSLLHRGCQRLRQLMEADETIRQGDYR